MRIYVSIIATSMLLLHPTGCKKDSGGDSGEPSHAAADSGADGDEGANDEGHGGAPGGPGSLNIGKVAVGVQAINSLDLGNSQVEDVTASAPGSLAIQTSTSLDVGNSLPADPPDVEGELNFITSGPADAFRIWIKNISFVPAEDGQKQPVFSPDEAVMLEIDGAAVDLSELIANADGGSGKQAEFSAPVGTYKAVEITYLKRAEIKGCVSGVFESRGDSRPDEYKGQHEYCTQTSKSLYTGDKFYNEHYEKTGSNNLSAEWMKIELGKEVSFYARNPGEPVNPPDTDETTEYLVEYELGETFEVTEDEAIDLTFVLDMNRLLRYSTGADHPPPEGKTYAANDNTTKHPASFIETAFRGSSFIFPGKPGRIYAYEVLSLVCTDANENPGTGESGDENLDVSNLPTSASCDSPSSFFAVNTWITMITNPSGKPISLLIKPKDDTRLTTLDGGHAPDPEWIFPRPGGATADIRYGRGEHDGRCFRGTIFDFPSDLESIAINGNPVLLHWDVHGHDENDRDGNRICPTDATQGNGNETTSGVAYFWRRL